MQQDPAVQFVTIDSLRLAYRVAGNLSNPAMVLLHGLAETSAFFWRPLIDQFSDNYHIIAFDLLGHGDSDHPDDGYEVECQAQLIRRALEQMGISRVVLVGHSLGGMIAARLSIDAPYLVHKLVLYDAPLSDRATKNFLMFVRNVPFTALLLLGSLIFPKNVARIGMSIIPLRLATRMILRRWGIPYRGDELSGEFLDHALRNNGVALMQCARSAYLRHNIVQDLHHLQTPTCMIVGDSDRLLPVPVARRMTYLIPNGQLRVIKQAGHVALLDQPKRFNQALEHFLQT